MAGYFRTLLATLHLLQLVEFKLRNQLVTAMPIAMEMLLKLFSDVQNQTSSEKAMGDTTL